MERIFVFIVTLVVSCSSYANCNFTNPNDILNLIKNGHPEILLNKANGLVLEKTIEQAEQNLSF